MDKQINTFNKQVEEKLFLFNKEIESYKDIIKDLNGFINEKIKKSTIKELLELKKDTSSLLQEFMEERNKKL